MTTLVIIVALVAIAWYFIHSANKAAEEKQRENYERLAAKNEAATKSVSDFVRSLTAEEFPYKATAFIEQHEDETDGHEFFTGHVYIKRKQ